MRVIVCGSRNYGLTEVIRARVRALPADAFVIVGGARGADTVAERAAKARGLDVETVRPDYARHGALRAPWVRNAAMLKKLEAGERNEARLVIAFWDGQSTGTAGMIAKARKAGFPLEVWGAGGERIA